MTAKNDQRSVDNEFHWQPPTVVAKNVYEKEKFKLKKLFTEIKKEKKIETIFTHLTSFPNQSKMFFNLTKIFNHTKQINNKKKFNGY